MKQGKVAENAIKVAENAVIGKNCTNLQHYFPNLFAACCGIYKHTYSVSHK